MPFLTLLLTSPFVFLAHSRKHEQEPFIIIKLFGIWMLSLVYITINDNFRVPLGALCAILIVYKSQNNRKSKFAALLIGVTSLFLSSLVYLAYKN